MPERELFVNIMDAKQKIECWRREYNGERPHSSLVYRTPSEYAAICSELTGVDFFTVEC
jgi:hypothetical protein